MSNFIDFRQIEWDERTIDDCRQLIRLAIREDLDRGHDLTTLAMVPAEAIGTAYLVARKKGVISGLPIIRLLIDEMNLAAEWTSSTADGSVLEAGSRVGRMHGKTRDLLTGERIMLNFIGRLSGIATVTRTFVEAVAGTGARIYDTRKTTPGWRRLEKYAVRCGGGHSHRTGLFDAVLIKDNHLAQAARLGLLRSSPAQAVQAARDFLDRYLPEPKSDSVMIEVEVDTVEQFQEALPLAPNIILLDNMSLDQLRTCVALRDQSGLKVQLEASGGISLATVGEVAGTGVDRISVGGITHSAPSLDVALDWEES